MSWILHLGLFLLLAILAAVIGFWLRSDPGMVYVRFHGWEIESSVVFVTAATALLLALCWGVYVLVIRWPRRMGLQRRRRATARLDDGLVQAFEGKLHNAQRALLDASPEPLQRLSALLCAAEVAHRRGESGLAEQILQNAAELDRGQTLAPMLADAWRAERGDEAAFEAIARRAEAADAPPTVLRTLIEGLLSRTRASEALAPLERVSQWRQIGDRELAALELRVLAQALEQAPDRETLDDLWKRFGKLERRDVCVLGALVHAEKRVGSRNLAAEALEAALTRDWSEPLAFLYANAPVETASLRIKRAENFLLRHPQSPGLLLALSRWCRIEQIYGKAQEYLRLSISLAPMPESLAEAARLAEARGEIARAALAWRLAAESSLGKTIGPDELQTLLR